MALATGVAKRVSLVEEVTFGVSPVTGSKYLRRLSSDLSLTKDAYESQEILVSQQLRDARHGVRRGQGTFSGQLSPGSFSDFFQGTMRGAYTSGVVLGPISSTLAVIGGTFTIGSGFLASGIKKDDIIRITGAGAPNTALNGVNLRVNNLTDTVLTTRDLPTGLTLGTLATTTFTVVGKKVIMPTLTQLYKSYSIEHWFSDIAQSELFTGCKFGQTTISMPGTGLITFNSQIIARNMTEAVTQQLTTPTGPTSSNSLAAVNGELSLNNVDVGIVTGLNMSIIPALEAPPVVGTNIVPWIFSGRLRVTGSLTALFQDQTVADLFNNEVECGLSVYLTVGGALNADFMKISLPRIKLMSDQKSDGEMSLVQSMNFTAMENVTDTFSDLTTMSVQDSLA